MTPIIYNIDKRLSKSATLVLMSSEDSINTGIAWDIVSSPLRHLHGCLIKALSSSKSHIVYCVRNENPFNLPMSPDVTGSSTRLDMGQFFFSSFICFVLPQATANHTVGMSKQNFIFNVISRTTCKNRNISTDVWTEKNKQKKKHALTYKVPTAFNAH